MTAYTPPIFASNARRYAEAGMWVRPIAPGSKACRIEGWPTPDPELPEGTITSWIHEYPFYGIGLLMGSPIADGTTLGALDIDRDHYLALGKALLNDPPCVRIGQRGAAIFVRVRGNPAYRAFRAAGEGGGQVAECLFSNKLCVIPPTKHPGTGKAYYWERGISLLDIDLRSLPLVETAR